jgi:MFS transporter, CP family, cyanate transporter
MTVDRQTPAASRSTVNGLGSTAVPLALAVLGTAINLRLAVASVPPLIDEIRDDVPLSATAAGVLTTLPVICMSVGAAAAPRLARRMGYEAALVLVGLAMAAGILVRLPSSVVALYAGTIIAGIGVAFGNVLVPSVVKRDFHQQVGVMTGAYTMAISASAGIAAGLTVPIEDAIGHGWHAALAVWALPAVVAALIWVPYARHAAHPDTPKREAGGYGPMRLIRDPLARHVTVFMGLQSLNFYALLSWMPSLLRDHGISKGAAGAYLSLFTLLGIPVCLIVPTIAARMRDQRALLAGTVVVIAAGLFGLMLSPATGTFLWPFLLGVGQASNLALVFLFFGVRSNDSAGAADLSSMAQTAGYAIAALGPLVVSVLHAATDGWTLPVIFLLVLLIPQLVFGLEAARDRKLAS